MKEIWSRIYIKGKRIRGYRVSNLGRVISLNRYVKIKQCNHIPPCRCNKGRHYKGKLLSPGWAGSGKKKYLFVQLSNNNRAKGAYVHILVATAFVPNPERKPDVNHKDGNKMNCRWDNLEWATEAENNEHALRLGLNRRSRKTGRFRRVLT